MAGIYTVWANRLTATDDRLRKDWNDVPARTRPGVLEELEERVRDGKLTQGQFDEITSA